MTTMRTTIEISDDHRAKLLEIAARRGLKGFSAIVHEAIELYLREVSPRDEKVESAVAVLGSLGEAEADALEASVRELRGRWR
jgi:metal-responsive CopG/Arc/MetJ family transcriptional regulator